MKRDSASMKLFDSSVTEVGIARRLQKRLPSGHPVQSLSRLQHL